MNEFEKAIAAADQFGEQAKDVLAPVLWAYFEALVKKGFTRDEALFLTKDVQQTLFGGKNK